jgi:hypothetical protein
VTDLRLTHIGGPTVLIEAAGWRLLTDPTFDPPGGKYAFGWGTGSRKLTGPAIAASELGRLDAVLLTHEHHEDKSRRRRPSAPALGRRYRYHRLRCPAPRQRRPRTRAVGGRSARGAGSAGEQDGHRGDGDTAHQPDRRDDVLAPHPIGDRRQERAGDRAGCQAKQGDEATAPAPPSRKATIPSPTVSAHSDVQAAPNASWTRRRSRQRRFVANASRTARRRYRAAATVGRWT